MSDENIFLKRCTGFRGPHLQGLKRSDWGKGSKNVTKLIILTSFRLQIHKMSLDENKIHTCLTKIYPLFKETVFHKFRKNFGPLLTSHRLKLPNLRKLLNQKNILTLRKKKILFPGFPKKFIPVPGEWGIPGMMHVLKFFIPIPTIPGNSGNENGNSREFFIPRASLVSLIFDCF